MDQVINAQQNSRNRVDALHCRSLAILSVFITRKLSTNHRCLDDNLKPLKFRSVGGSQQPSPKLEGSASTNTGGAGRSVSVASSPGLSRKTSSGSTGMREDYKRHKRAASLRSR